jgi:hypothetical protein
VLAEADAWIRAQDVRQESTALLERFVDEGVTIDV